MGRSPPRFARRGVGGLREHGIESSFKVRGSESCFNAHEKNSGEKERLRLTIQDRERTINSVQSLRKWNKISPDS